MRGRCLRGAVYAMMRILLALLRFAYGAQDRHWEAVDGALSESAVAIVAGWGKPPRGLASYRDRVAQLKAIADDVGCALMCFGTNEDGSPKHPLYLPSKAPLVEWYRGRNSGGVVKR